MEARQVTGTQGTERPSHVCTAAHDLYEQHATALYRFCYARLRSREAAEDALQTTFARACGALANGVRPRHAAAWLFKIAHNVCVSQRLAEARRGRLERAHDLAVLETRLAAPEREDGVELDAALAALPGRLRTAFLLREVQGLSYAEVAERMETSLAAVETLIFRARRQLAAALAPGLAA